MHHIAVTNWSKSFAQKIDLRPYKNILDIGCRKGHVSYSLAQQYPDQQFYAIDNVTSEIEHAKQFCANNLEFATEDALALHFQNNFDAVVSFNCLFWIQNKQQVLQNIYRALKPGGKGFFQFFATHGRARNDRFVYHVANQAQWKPHFKWFHTHYHEVTLKEFGMLLQQAGFILHKMEFSCNPITLDHQEVLSHFYKSWASHTKFLSLKKQDHFFNEVSMEYLKFYQLPEDAAFTYNEYLLEVICEKPLEEYKHPLPEVIQYGPIHFTLREAQVLKHFLQGKSSKEIAIILDISSKTIEFHLKNVKNKLHCHKRSQLYQAAFSYGFIHLMFDEML